MQNDISKEFSLGGLLRFTFPTIIMMMFVATYIIADGIFVSRFVGTAALSAINIVYPLINVMLGVGIMLGTGGSAIIGRGTGGWQRRSGKTAFYTADTLCYRHGADPFSALLCIHRAPFHFSGS